jgi:hypothetical protein
MRWGAFMRGGAFMHWGAPMRCIHALGCIHALKPDTVSTRHQEGNLNRSKQQCDHALLDGRCTAFLISFQACIVCDKQGQLPQEILRNMSTGKLTMVISTYQ